MGVGTRLKEKIEKLWINAKGCGKCDDLAKTMDTAGPKWCRNRFGEIIEKMRANAAAKEILFVQTIAEAMLMASIEEEEELQAQAAELSKKCFEDRVLAVLEDVAAGARKRETRWQWKPEVIEAHRRLFAGRISEILSQPASPDGFGCGIVTLGGSLQYFPAVYVLCHTLRQLGCKLPIEVWYLNRYEFDPRMESLLLAIEGVSCVHGLESIPAKPRCFGGWDAKAWAIQHSRFDEVLFLDADIVPAGDPSYLFQHEKYLEFGAIAWPNWDHAVSYTASTEAFEMLGLPVPGRDPKKEYPGHNKPTDYRPWETGQLLVDKRKHWHAIEIAKLFSDHSDFWYPDAEESPIVNWHSYGDTAVFPLAFDVAGTKAHLVESPCLMFGTPNGGGLVQHDPDGEICWNHRCRPARKIRVTGVNPNDGLVRPAEFDAAVADIRSKWKAVPWDWRDQSTEELAHARLFMGEWFATGARTDRSRVTLADRGVVEGGRRVHWRIWLDGDKPKVVLSDGQQAFAILENHRYGLRDVGRGVCLFYSAPKWWDGILTQTSSWVWGDIIKHNEYRLPPLMTGQIVVDIGANEGVFSHACFSRGAGKVFAVEPNRMTFSRLVRNLDNQPGSVCLNNAVWRSDEQPKWVYLDDTAPDTSYSDPTGCVVTSAAGRYPPVLTIGLDPLLDKIRPLVGNIIDLLKLDCEGSEWPILLSGSNLSGVQAIVAELHADSLWNYPDWWGVPKTKGEAESQLCNLLAKCRFNYVVEWDGQDGMLGHLWAWRQGADCPFIGLNSQKR